MLLALVDQEYSWHALGVGHAPLTQRSLVFLENRVEVCPDCFRGLQLSATF